MITELPESSGRDVGFLIQEKLTDEDYKQTLIPVIEEAIKDQQKINVLFQMHLFRGWTTLSTGRKPNQSNEWPLYLMGNGTTL